MTYIKVPIFILEGPDGSGKTTTGVAMAKKLSGIYIHNNQFSKLTTSKEMHAIFSAQLYCAEDLCALTLSTVVPLIIDRSWISELVYGKVYRPKPRIDAVDAEDLCKLATRLQATIINCRPPWDVVRENFQAEGRDELLSSVEQLQKVYDLYSPFVFPGRAYETVDYDYTEQTLNSLIDYLLDNVDKLK